MASPLTTSSRSEPATTPTAASVAGSGTTRRPQAPSSRRKRRTGKNGTMHVSAKVDYAMRALLVIAQEQDSSGSLIKGDRLARPASEITVADVVRALDGPLADVRGDRPENADYNGAAAHLGEVWIATRAALRSVLDHVTLADIAKGELPPTVTEFTQDPSAWS